MLKELFEEKEKVFDNLINLLFSYQDCLKKSYTDDRIIYDDICNRTDAIVESYNGTEINIVDNRLYSFRKGLSRIRTEKELINFKNNILPQYREFSDYNFFEKIINHIINNCSAYEESFYDDSSVILACRGVAGYLEYIELTIFAFDKSESILKPTYA